MKISRLITSGTEDFYAVGNEFKLNLTILYSIKLKIMFHKMLTFNSGIILYEIRILPVVIYHMESLKRLLKK